MKKLLVVVILFLTFGCMAQPKVKALEGIWKVEGKEQYEAWQKDGENLIGQSYRIKEGNKYVTETLALKLADDKIVYEATVPNQNEGKTIQFTLNKDVLDVLSFENPNHDFPTKIIYKFETKNRLFVQVQGADGKGFSFYMDRQ